MVVFFIGFCVLWILFLFFSHKAISSLHPITAYTDILKYDARQADASISIVIAVKDDAMNIERTLLRLTELEYPHLDVIVVNDRSQDETQLVIEKIARSHQRIRYLQIKELPDGWLGKVHALQQGLTLAKGQYILFMDADVIITDDLLYHAAALSDADRLDHLAILPRVNSHFFILELLVVTSEILFTLSYRPWLAIENRPLACVKGVGPCNMIRRSYYETTEGLRWLKMDVADDVALAQLVAKDGGRSLFTKSPTDKPFSTWTWYPTAGHMIRGLEKNTVGGFTNYKISLIVLMPLISIGCFVVPFVGLFAHESWILRLSLLSILATIVFAVCGKRYLARPFQVLVALPVGIAILGLILARSAYYCLKNDGIQWSGTFYPLQALRDGTRVKLGL